MNNDTLYKSIDHMTPIERALKRSGDVIGAILCLVCLSPIFFAIFLIQKFGVKGPVIYSQERIGKNGKPFRIYKFRTMVPGAENEGPVLASPSDDRVTRVGKFLRNHHLDELPQLWNVLRGDMSFVGYRPERQFYIDKIVTINPDYTLLFCSRPGVTSLATVYNGYTDTMEKMLKRLDMDLDYLRKRTLWFDIKIVLTTFVSLIRDIAL